MRPRARIGSLVRRGHARKERDTTMACFTARRVVRKINAPGNAAAKPVKAGYDPRYREELSAKSNRARSVTRPVSLPNVSHHVLFLSLSLLFLSLSAFKINVEKHKSTGKKNVKFEESGTN